MAAVIFLNRHLYREFDISKAITIISERMAQVSEIFPLKNGRDSPTHHKM